MSAAIYTRLFIPLMALQASINEMGKVQQNAQRKSLFWN